MKKYMHLLDGKPAEYDGKQVVYSRISVKNFATDLKQIRKEQKASITWRKARGYPVKESEYGHIIVVQQTQQLY